MSRSAVASILLVMLGPPAAAEPGERDEPTARDTADAPRPGNESGRLDREDRPASRGRAVGGVLAVLRALVTAASAPVRGIVWLDDRLNVVGRYKQWFFNDAGTMGLYPIAQVDSRFGLTAGAKFSHEDLFGAGEQLSARAATGGRFAQRHALSLKSGERLGTHLTLEAAGEFEQRPREVFYGIGNDGPGVAGRHTQDKLRTRAAVDVRVVGDFYVRGAGALSRLEYGASSTDTSIEMVYDTASIPGFMGGVRDLYGEVEMRYDSRRPGSRWDLPGMVSGGGLAAVFAGRDHQYGVATDYWRYGVDLQHFLRLGMGPRVLGTRLRGEAVEGEDVAFTELPQLGGPSLLRGYPIDRFRDRAAMLATVEYQWDVNRHVMASLFVDAGRVYSRVEAIRHDAFDDLRVGYGFGLQFLVAKGSMARTSIATSKDGGVFFHFSFDPTFAIQPREERR